MITHGGYGWEESGVGQHSEGLVSAEKDENRGFQGC